ncbi:hypothetical protein K1719_047259 [Acacia pycnantha]|nr:hypothetical protein K1719_047259 [Acacia pycnantha]
MGLEVAVEAAAEFLNKAVKPVLVGGPKLRVANASQAFVELADACSYAFAVMPSAKGLVPEVHLHFNGTYWGAVSTSFCAEIVESADAYLFAGPIFNDYSSVGYSLLLKKEKAIILQPDRVIIGNGPAFGCVLMKDFLRELAKRIKHNDTSFKNYDRIFVPEGKPLRGEPKEPLRGCGYEFQMQYGSIGWSVGATLGYAQAVPEKRVIACIGDGSFQMTVQENWNYTAFVDAIHNGEGKCWTTKVSCEEELIEAIETATGPKKDSLCFIEVIAHRDDNSKELLEWGSRVSAANSRPPNPQ